MTKKTWTGVAVLVAALVTAVTVGASLLIIPASADTDLPDGAIPVNRNCNTDWYVNHDEGDRKPGQLDNGLVFKNDQLVHHAPEKDIALADLEPGSFEATPAPSLASFFSVEVRDAGTGGYATLRWDATDKIWVLGGTNTKETDPAKFIDTVTKWGKLTDQTKVASFGVGYTANPNNGTKTVVTSVTFGGDTYKLACTPKPAPTVTVTAKPTTPPTIPGRTLPAPNPVRILDTTTTTVRIRWTGTPKGAVAFAVFANGTRHGTIYGHEYRFRGLKKGTTYTFTVRARGADAGLGAAGSVKARTDS